MLPILIACASVIFVVGMLFLMSKSEDPVEKRKDEDDMDQSSERIFYMDDYKPMWSKKVNP